MKRYFFIFSFLCLTLFGYSTTVFVPLTTGFVNGNSLFPGDTILVESGARSLLSIARAKGTLLLPIYIVNDGGIVTITSSYNDGIKLNECEYLVITGTGTADLYGFKISATNVGVHGFNKTTNIEVSNTEIFKCDLGIMIKTRAYIRNTFTQKNTSIHDNYIHNIALEGIYLGSSFYQNGNYPLLDGVSVYNNIIDSTGWDGIQVGSASYNCSVYGNEVTNYAYKNVYGQTSGIMLNPGSSCDCYRNNIHDGNGAGIFDQGNGNNKLYNNLIVNTGVDNDWNKPRGSDGIAVWGLNRNWSAGNSIYIYNNTIINPKNNGISFEYDENIQGDSSRIQNNIIVNPGSYNYYTWAPNKSYIEMIKNPTVTISHNIFTQDIDSLDFTAFNDFSLLSSSIAVDQGIDLVSENIVGDFADNPRDAQFDIGAYEYMNVFSRPSQTLAAGTRVYQHKFMATQKEFNVYPNPASDYIFIEQEVIKNENRAFQRIAILDMSGKELISSEINKTNKKVEISFLPKGIYFVKVGSGNMIYKFVKD